MRKLWLAGLVVALLLAMSLRAKPLGLPHTLEFDSEGMFRLAREVVETGSVPEHDKLVYAGYFPDGWPNDDVLPLTPYLIAALSLGKDDYVKAAAQWYPLIAGIIGLIVVSYIGKLLWGDPGLIAGALLGVVPGYLFRTTASASDKEPICMLLMFIGIYFYLSALKKRDYFNSVLSGISFGLASWGWGGYILFVLPIAMFAFIRTLMGHSKEQLVFIGVLTFYFFNIVLHGVEGIHSIESILILGVAGYILLDYFAGPMIKKKPLTKNIMKGVERFVHGLGKPFDKVALPQTSLISCLIIFVLGIAMLMAMGYNPANMLQSLSDRIVNPIRVGLHARSVGEQVAPSYPSSWESEMDALRIAYPLVFFINPTQGLNIILLTSIPIIFVVFLGTKRWEDLFVTVWAFFAHMAAIGAIRLFFPMIPAAVLALTGAIAYLLNNFKGIVWKVSLVIPIALFLFMLIPTTDRARDIGAQGSSLNHDWYESLMWYQQNSQQYSPLATWWDYGYWIQSARRPSLADGSNVYYQADVDLGRLFTYTNESDALSYLKKVNTHFITMDSPMISKFYWVSSIGFGDENKAITYPQFYYNAEVSQSFATSQSQFKNARVYVLPGSSEHLVVVPNGPILEGRVDPTRGLVFKPVDKIATTNGYMKLTNSTEETGAFIISSNLALYIPPQAEDMLFTRMFFLMGAGLNHIRIVFDNGFIRTFEAQY